MKKIYILAYEESTKYHNIYILGIRIRWKKFSERRKNIRYKKFSIWENIIGCKNSYDRKRKVFSILGIKGTKKIWGAVSLNRKCNKKIGKVDADIIHIMANNNYTGTFYNMINKYNVENKRHLFIIYMSANETHVSPIKENKDVIFGNICSLKINTKKTKKIIVHGLLEKHIFEWLNKNPQYLKITYWSIWGSDLYKFSGSMYDKVRRNVKAIISYYDEEKYKERYGEKLCYKAYYLNPLAKYLETLRQRNIKEDKNEIVIQINQCATEYTLKALDTLAKFKDKNIRIWTPTSYKRLGENISAKEIEVYGKKIFGDKFSIQNTYLSPEKFAEKILQNDIMIVNLDNQGGIGNIAAGFFLGNKIYVNSHSTTYVTFQKSNKIFYDSNKINEISYEDFIKYSKIEKEQNYENIKKFFSEEYVATLWNEIFIS